MVFGYDPECVVRQTAALLHETERHAPFFIYLPISLFLFISGHKI